MSPLFGLTLIFIYLKLTEQVDWPWWCVLMPFIVLVIINIVEKASNKS